MSDLISRPVLLRRSLPCPPSHKYADTTKSASYNFILGFLTARKMTQKLIEAEPAIDAIPITRCKDCRHCRVLGDGHSFECVNNDIEYYAPTYDAATYYCADAELKDDDDDA